MIIESLITQKIYDPTECVFIVNMKQVYKYIENNATLLDIILGEDDKLVFVFNRKDTYKLYDLWCKHAL